MPSVPPTMPSAPAQKIPIQLITLVSVTILIIIGGVVGINYISNQTQIQQPKHPPANQLWKW